MYGPIPHYKLYLTKVKYSGLVTEVIGNAGVSGVGGGISNVRIALAISTFIFGLLEGGISCWESMNENVGDDKSQFEKDIP